MDKLPIKKIFLAAVGLVLEKTNELFRIGRPILTLGLISIAFYHYARAELAEQLIADNLLLTAFVYVLFIMAAVMVVVGCHRIFLMRPEDVRNTKVIRWSSRETRFLGWWLLIGIAGFIIIVPVVVIGSLIVGDYSELILENDDSRTIFMILISILMYYFVARWSLVLPATAIDQRPDFRLAWNMSRGNSLRLLFLVGIIPIVTDTLLGFLPNFDSIIYTLIYAALWIIIAVVEIAILSLSYQWLQRRHDSMQEL